MNHKQLTHKQLTAQPLWKQIGKAKESTGQEFQPEAEMATSIQLDLFKVEHNMAKARTLITEDYINNASLAESGFIEMSEKRTKQSHSMKDKRRRQEYWETNTDKGINKHISQKFLKLTGEFSEFKGKYQEFCLNLLNEIEQFFSGIYEIILADLKSTHFHKIYTHQIELQNRQLKDDLLKSVRLLQEKTDAIYSLQKQLKQTKKLLEISQKTQKKHIYESQKCEHNEYQLARKRVGNRDQYGAQKLMLNSVGTFEPLNLEQMKQHIGRPLIRTKREKHSSEKFQPTLFSSQDLNKKDKRAEVMNKDLNAFQQKLKSLRSQIERIK